MVGLCFIVGERNAKLRYSREVVVLKEESCTNFLSQKYQDRLIIAGNWSTIPKLNFENWRPQRNDQVEA